MTATRIPFIALLIAGLAMAGCNPRNVETLTLDGPDRLETNQTGTFTATTNEDAKPPVDVSWDLGDGGEASGSSVDHSFDSAGSYNVVVTATNRKGKASVTSEHAVTVTDPPVPAEIVAVVASATSTDTQTPVSFSANVRGDAPLTYSWSFGDGTSADTPRAEHTFMEAGSYVVTLNLSNEHGRDARTAEVEVTVWEADWCGDLQEMASTFFERNSSELTDAGVEGLTDNVDVMVNACPNLNVAVEGMAGPFERNPQVLSEDRARAVMQFYVDNGVEARRISSTGVGRGATGTTKKSGAETYRRVDTIPQH